MSFLLWLILHLIISFALSCSYEWMEHKGGPRDCNDNNHDNTNNDNINNNNILLIITMIIILLNYLIFMPLVRTITTSRQMLQSKIYEQEKQL